MYLSFRFWPDLISVVPWPLFMPELTFLRLIKMTKLSDYQGKIDDYLAYQVQGVLNNQQIKKLQDLINLFVKLAILSHCFANLWVLLGLYERVSKGDGWVQHYLEEDVIDNDTYTNLYTISMYWVIVTFSSVGYGDITGKTESEMMYQMVVEMIGIGFFGYMIGVF